MFRHPLSSAAAIAVLLAGLAAGTPGPAQQPFELPANARALEGTPEVRVEISREGESRRVLPLGEATKNRLRIRAVEGLLYWGDDDRPLRVTSAGAFTYLMSHEPGRYQPVVKVPAQHRGRRGAPLARRDD